jgi:DNA polymerase III delta prime subunit
VKVEHAVLHPTAERLLDQFVAHPAHAVLLTGPVGIGKARIARSVAMQLLQVTSLENAAYFQEVGLEKNSISIDQIRKLIQFFRLTVPGSAPIKRVAIIQEADSMGHEAQNALLKLLEEPPVGSVLILLSSVPDRLLPTIRSRTQLLTLPAPAKEAVAQHFATLGYDKETVHKTLLRTGSNFAEASRLLAGDTEDQSLQTVKQVLTGSPYDRMLLVDGLSKQKEQAATFVITLAAMAAAGLQAAASKNTTAIPRWEQILEAANTAATALERSGNTKIVLTELMLAL